MPDQTTQEAARQEAAAAASSARTDGGGALIDPAAAMAGSRDQFLIHVLAAQCELAPAEGGAVLRLQAADTVQAMAVYPPLEQQDVAPPWLSRAADLVPAVVEAGATQIVSLVRKSELYGQAPNEFLVLVPVMHAQATPEVAAFYIRTNAEADPVMVRGRLELTASLLGYYDMQAAAQQRGHNLARMRTAMEIVAQVSEHEKFRSAAMTLCNEAAARWSAQRVSFGVLRGRYVKLQAISHTDRFSRKMRLVQDLESVMEECLDQDVEVVHPLLPGAGYVSRAASQCSMHHGPATICSLPMRRDGKVQAVLTIEREPDRPFTAQELEAMRLTADLASGWMLHLFDVDRWFGARLASGVKETAAAAVGPRHTWAKLTILLLIAITLFLALAKGPNRVEAPFEVQAPHLQAIVAPYDARLKAVHVKPNDVVYAGRTVLAEFDTSEMELQRIALQAEQTSYLQEQNAAVQALKSAEAQIAKSRADMLGAQIDLITHQIEQAKILAPIDGVVLSGDLERQINGQFERGAIMFELAPVNQAEAELSVPENRIGDLINEMKRRADAGDDRPLTGELATAANPGNYIPFEVYRIDSVAEVEGQRNVFKVHVRLTGTAEQINNLKKGMQGVAKIDIDRQRYITIWTRDLMDWVRMTLWI